MEQTEKTSLNDFLKVLTKDRGLHICIHDVSGILRCDELHIDYEYTIHSQSFCEAAKSSPAGYNACIAAKTYSNNRVINTGKTFEGVCPFGLLETAVPVVIDSETKCIIYAGHYRLPDETAEKRCAYMAEKVGASEKLLKSELEKCEKLSDRSFLLEAALVVSGYIKLLYEKNKDVPVREKYHWAVFNTMKYADENFRRPCTLRDISRLCRMNEKYLGRLFSSQVGQTFHEYMNARRLDYAAKLLSSTGMKIIDVAFESGFQTVTYFNRLFAKRYGISPVAYRLGR